MHTTSFSLALIKRIVLQARAYWLLIFLIFALNLLVIPIFLLKPYALKILIDSGFASQPLPRFITFFFPEGYIFGFPFIVSLTAILVVAIALVENVYIAVIWLLNTYTGEKLVLNFRSFLFNHLQRLSLLYHDKKGTADSLYRIQYDAVAIKTFLLNNLSPLVSSSITLLVMLGVMYNINAYFAFIVLCLVPILALITHRFSRNLKKDWKMVKQQETNAMSIVNEVLSSLRVIKAFGSEARENIRFTNNANQAVNGQLKVARTGALYYFCVGMVFAVATAIIILIGSGYVKSGRLTLGELTLVIAYMAQIYAPVEKITKNLGEIQSSLTSMDRVFTLLDREQEVRTAERPLIIKELKGFFTFDQVSFSYDHKKPIIRQICFDIRPGDRVGIIGSTGAGKSTLAGLLMRFYDPIQGTVLLDGIDIKQYDLQAYRGQFAIVLQEPVLFAASIAENIAYGRPEASPQDIIAAAKNANAHEFILGCTQGYETLVGERGVQLSGGQRQRIALARAFIRNAPVLIMDEPTSAVDVGTEALIMQSLERLMQGKNTFLITHRLDTLKMCNVIVHLEEGNIVDVVRDPLPGFLEQKKSWRELDLYNI